MLIRDRKNALRLLLTLTFAAGASNACSASSPSVQGGTLGDGGDDANPDASAESGSEGGMREEAGPVSDGKKRVFVTSGAFTGNLKDLGQGIDGVDGADRLCNAAAANGRLAGTFKAWLSADANNARNRIAAVGPWYLPGRAMPAVQKTFLADDVLDGAISADENGRSMAVKVWTATRRSGFAANLNCADWTKGTLDNGDVGDSTAKNFTWTELATDYCELSRHLYCFEQ